MTQVLEPFFLLDREFGEDGADQDIAKEGVCQTQKQQSFHAKIDWEDDGDIGWSQLDISGVYDETAGPSQSKDQTKDE